MKLEIIKYLIKEIEEEKDLIKLVKTDERKARFKAEAEKEKTGKFVGSWHYQEYKGRQPSKVRIKDNCKKVRQLMLEISKEI